jgi:hypothetical protein
MRLIVPQFRMQDYLNYLAFDVGQPGGLAEVSILSGFSFFQTCAAGPS